MKRTLKKMVQGLVGFFGYRFASNYDSVIDEDKRFVDIYNKCRPYTMTTKERMWALYKSVEYIVDAEIPGDFVECGVWAGGSVMLIASTLLALNVTNRKVYLYDTFTGMSEQTDEDYHVEDKNIRRHSPSYVPLDEVKKNMSSTGYPQTNTVFVKGKVEETVPRTTPSQIAILRLDTDWYESTKHELIYLFPLVSKGGILIVDDYAAWAGSKKATDEYFSGGSMLLNRIDHDSRIGVKIR